MQEYLSSFTRLEFDKVRGRIGGYLQTPAGADHAAALAPLSDGDRIRDELALTSEMRRLLGEGAVVPIRSLPDLRTPLHRASIAEYALPAEDLLAIAHLASNAREMRTFFSAKASEYPRLSGLVAPLTVNKVLEYNIGRAIDAEGRVADAASQALNAVRRAIRRKGEALRSQMESILASLHKKGITQEELITTRDGRLVIPVRAEFKNQIPGFIHSISASGATAFIEPTQTLEMNNELRTLESQERQEVEKILRELTAQVREAIPDLLANIAVIARMDFLHAKARYSVEIGGSEPRIGTGRRALRLKGAIHPLLLATHPRNAITPLDLEAGESFNVLIISGPNAGGKSDAMKTVGLLSVMAQAGCHIPASPDSELCVFSEIFVEMGDEQSIENDLSTFSGHLKNLKTIVEHSTAGSLVLIDEIGSGTDPALGSAIGIAVLEALCARDCLTIVTSHHSAFKTAGFEHDRMENAGMGFDSGTLRPNYRLSVGRPGNSYALEIARTMELPGEVVARAIELAGGESVKLTEQIARFEERTAALEEALRSAAEKDSAAGDRLRLYESKLNEVKKEVREIRSRAESESRELVEELRRRVREVVRELRESSASPQGVKKAREEIAALQKLQPAAEEPGPEPIPDLRPGTLVRVRGTETVGEVIELTDRKRVVIESGGKRVVVPLNLLEAARDKPVVTFRQNDFIETVEVSNEIDLRGLFGDESIDRLDKFLDKSVLLNLKRVRIIHGKGTGALRKRVAEFLTGDRRVSSFQLGEWNEGGAGVTIAVLGE